MMNESVEEVENRHVIEMVNGMVVESWKRLEVNRLVKDILNSEDNIKLRVVTILMEKNTEDKELLDTLEREESKLRRLKRIEMLKNTCKNKMQAKKLRSMLQMLRKLSLGELEMDIDEMELWAEEMMDVVESDDREEPMEDADSSTIDYGDKVDMMDVVDRDNGMGLESKSGVIPKVTPKGGGCQSEDNSRKSKYTFLKDQYPTTTCLGENVPNKGFGVEISSKRKRESSLTMEIKKWRGFGPT